MARLGLESTLDIGFHHNYYNVKHSANNGETMPDYISVKVLKKIAKEGGYAPPAFVRSTMISMLEKKKLIAWNPTATCVPGVVGAWELTQAGKMAAQKAVTQ